MFDLLMRFGKKGKKKKLQKFSIIFDFGNLKIVCDQGWGGGKLFSGSGSGS